MKASASSIRSRVRLFEILVACNEAGLREVPLQAVHTIAYFTDALSPVWGFPIVEAQILKRKYLRSNPDLQNQIDELVGEAVLIATDIRHVSVNNTWHLDANYRVNPTFSARILTAIEADDEFARELFFVREVVLALIGLGAPGLANAQTADATYSDPTVDYGNMIDLATQDGRPTRTTEIANRFAALLGAENVSPAELTHLYVRHLYRVLGAGVD